MRGLAFLPHHPSRSIRRPQLADPSVLFLPAGTLQVCPITSPCERSRRSGAVTPLGWRRGSLCDSHPRGSCPSPAHCSPLTPWQGRGQPHSARYPRSVPGSLFPSPMSRRPLEGHGGWVPPLWYHLSSSHRSGIGWREAEVGYHHPSTIPPPRIAPGSAGGTRRLGTTTPAPSLLPASLQGRLEGHRGWVPPPRHCPSSPHRSRVGWRDAEVGYHHPGTVPPPCITPGSALRSTQKDGFWSHLLSHSKPPPESSWGGAGLSGHTCGKIHWGKKTKG